MNDIKTEFRNDAGDILVYVGDVIKWKTIGGSKYVGIVRELDSNVAYVEIPNGRIIPVEL